MTAITRTDYRNALFTLLETRKAASPTALHKVYRYRPGGTNEGTVAWVGAVVEQLNRDVQIRKHTFGAEIVIVTGFPTDLITDADPFDGLEANLVEDFEAATHAVHPNTILTLTTAADTDVVFAGVNGLPDVTRRGLVLGTTLEVWEGRA